MDILISVVQSMSIVCKLRDVFPSGNHLGSLAFNIDLVTLNPLRFSKTNHSSIDTMCFAGRPVVPW
ncbi:hypothetical protein ADUPG1_001297, partial [Aduncisulcus paluster]